MSAYLATFPEFVPDPHAPLKQEFERLAASRKWEPSKNRYKNEWHKYLISEYDLHIGVIDETGKLEQLQDLCRELGVRNVPATITKCKNVLKTRVHVNLVDLIDSRRQPNTKVKVFPTRQALAEHTREEERFFPLTKAKENSLVKTLLRNIERVAK